MNNNYFSVPVPNIGSCAQKGMWPDPAEVTDCQACISGSTQDYPLFYCDGNCMSKYNLNGSCSLNSLVAKNMDQCNAPCVQVAPPSVGPHNCEDMFDCQTGQDCEQGVCVKATKQQPILVNPDTGKGRHTKNPTKIPKTPTSTSQSKFLIPMIGLLVILLVFLFYILLTGKY